MYQNLHIHSQHLHINITFTNKLGIYPFNIVLPFRLLSKHLDILDKTPSPFKSRDITSNATTIAYLRIAFQDLWSEPLTVSLNEH
jgi:hypothetical protein